MSYNNNPDAKYKDPDYLYQEFIINNKSVEQIAQENNVTKKAVTWQLYTHGIKKNGNKISKEQLEELYIKQNLSIEDTARALNTNSRLVSRYLDNYGIKKTYYKYNPVYDSSNDAAWIDLYLNKHLSALQIANMYGTSHHVVIGHLQHNGIETRTMQEAQRVLNGNYFIHPALMDKDNLINLHYNHHYSLGVIADIYRCDLQVVKTCFNNLGIKYYTQKNSLEAPPAIYVDHHFEASLTQKARSYCNQVINPVILYRDQYKCRLCGSNENLEVHHHILSLSQIVYICADMNMQYSISDNIEQLFEIVKHDALFNDLDNMVTLCSNCHHKIHYAYKNITENQQPSYN